MFTLKSSKFLPFGVLRPQGDSTVAMSRKMFQNNSERKIYMESQSIIFCGILKMLLATKYWQ